MKIRTQLIAGLAIFALLLILISALLVTTSRQVEELDRQREIANNIALEVGELSYLTNDYTLYREPRQADRWRSKYDEIDRSLTGLALETPGQQAIADTLRGNLRNIRSVFDDVSAAPVQPGGPALAVVQLSWSRMAVQTQVMVFDAGRLSDLLESEATRRRTENNLLILSLMAAFSGFLLMSYILFYRRTLRSITDLQEGTKIIGSGNLDHTIARTSDDEVGDLAQAINRMASSLKSVTASKSDLEREVSERKKLEVELTRKQTEIQTLFDSTPAGLVLFDAAPPYTVLVHNRYYQELFAEPFRSRGMAGLTIYEYAPAVEAEGVVAVFDEVVRTMGPKRILDFPYRSNPPKESWFNWYLSPIIIDGKVVALVSMSLDVTDRHLAEHALRESEERLRTLYDSMTEGFASHEVVYADGKAVDYIITAVNPAFERITGIPRGEAVGRKASDLYGTGNPPYLGVYARVASGAGPEHFETYFPPMKQHFSVSAFSPGKGKFATVFTDITERKQGEQSLREAELRYRTVAENTFDWEFWLDPEGRFIYCSPSCERIAGHTSDEFLADPGLRKRLIHPDDLPEFERHLLEVEGTRIGGPGEWRFLRPDGSWCWVEHVCQPVYGDKGEFLGIRGSNRDITRRKETEKALRESEGRFRALAEAMPQIVWSADASGAMDYYNPQALSYGGIPPEQARGWNWESLIHPEDLPRTLAAWENALKDGVTSVIEHRLRRADGEYRWHLTRGAASRDENGIIIRWIGTATDIHDMKITEGALRESEERYRVLIDSAPDAILVHADGKVLYANPAAIGLYGAGTLGELKAWNVVTELAPLEDIETTRDRIRRLDGAGRLPLREAAILRLDGTRVPVEVVASAVQYGGFRAAQVILRDITDRKRSEERIAHLASFPELNPNPVIELNFSGEVVYANPAVALTLDALGIGDNPSDLLPEDIREMLPILMEGDTQREVMVGGRVILETISMNPRSRTIRIYGKEITELKHAESSLRETSQYLENLITYANAPIIVWDPELRITRFNKAFERLTGRPAGEVMGKTLDFLFPAETLEGSMDHIRRVMAGERWEAVELPVIHRDGSIRTVLWNSATLYEADGITVSSAIAQGQDITDRKQMEEELYDTSQYLQNLLNYANAPIIVWDPWFRITRFNHAFERLTGRSAEEVVGQNLEILFPAETVQESMEHIRRAMAGERLEVVEIPILHKDGGIRTVLWNSATLYEADGKTVSSAIAQGQDITDRKKAEQELAGKVAELADLNAELSAEIAHRKKAEEEVKKTISILNAALESTADAMLVLDRSGRITSYNQNFRTMWNIPESVLHTLDPRIAIDHLAGQMRDHDGFVDRMREISDHPPRESFDMLELLDGRIIERYSKPQKIGNFIVGRVYSFRDITERKRAELQLISSLEEKEILLREIHHRVKNNLQLTTSLLDMTRLRTTDPGTASILTDIMMKIQTMAQIHTRLYESKQFDRINMGGQIRDQIRAIMSIYGAGDREIAVEIDSPELYLPLDQAIPCALALNEILSNAYKHAFRGRKSGTVWYSAEELDGRIRFTIRDNGVGLPGGFDLNRANTLGLKLVRTLVQQQLRGTLEIRRRKRGTEVIVELPREWKEENHVNNTRG
jgi:PAS domain S-box-containing protein